MRTRRDNPKLTRVATTGIIGLLLAGTAVTMVSAESRGAAYARVRHFDGYVTVVRATEGTIADASINTPLVPGDRIATDDGRVEIELADSSLVWLDVETSLDLLNLSDIGLVYGDANLITLIDGSMRISTYDPGDDDQVFQVDTEAGSIYLLSGGAFRIDADRGLVTLSVFRGVAELSGDGGSVLVRSGERSSVRGGRAPSEPRHFNTARLDNFDQYCDERRFAYLRQGDDLAFGVAEELPPEVRHYAVELSTYGRWHSVPDYGWVWRPVYHGSWSPYFEGHWTWCATGWSWVSYEPWGWAPYHYGRWDHVASIGWVWIPGRHWSGAWVSFAIGPTYIGWAPLNYYNRPVFHDVRTVSHGTVRVSDLNSRGWSYARMDNFTARGAKRAVLRGDRVPRGSNVVITGRLPHFDPQATAKRPDRGKRLVEEARTGPTPLQVSDDEKGRPVSFRTFERQETGKVSARTRAQRRQSLSRWNEDHQRRSGSAASAPRGGDRGTKAATAGAQPQPRSTGAQGFPRAGDSAERRKRDRGESGHVIERLFRSSRQRRSQIRSTDGTERRKQQVGPATGRKATSHDQGITAKKSGRDTARSTSGSRKSSASERPGARNGGKSEPRKESVTNKSTRSRSNGSVTKQNAGSKSKGSVTKKSAGSKSKGSVTKKNSDSKSKGSATKKSSSSKKSASSKKTDSRKKSSTRSRSHR